MSRFFSFSFALGLFFSAFTSPASAQIDPQNVAQVIQNKDVVGRIYVDLPPGPCSSVEQWFLYEDYQYPDAKGGKFTVESASATDVSFESFLAAQYAAHPKGTLVTVEIEETSANCPAP